jgi:hypothetical protein
VGSEREGLASGSGCDGWGVGDGSITAGEDSAADSLDGAMSAGLVAVHVLCAGGVVLDLERHDLHAEGALGVVGRSACPRDGARGVF